MDFRLAPYRFLFRTLDEVRFPEGKSGNVFRGALGLALRRLSCSADCPGPRQCRQRVQCAYARLFEPVLDSGPSGLADPPRPFVLRPRFSEGRVLPAGTLLRLDVHVFDIREDFLPALTAALSEVAATGFGPGRGRAELAEVEAMTPLQIDLAVDQPAVSRIRVDFLTPTELKADGALVSQPEFGTLIARVRDRVATLDRLYGTGAVRFDWNALTDRASAVRLASAQLRFTHVERRSSRTGRTHPLGGFVGPVEYEGDIAPFMGLLRAGEWTGVGRHTVWGKGAYRIAVPA